MLQCRRLCPAANTLADHELKAIRDGMYEMAVMLIGAYQRSAPLAVAGIDAVPESDRFDVEERAAIVEFDCNLTRRQAERLAITQYLRSKSPH